MNGQVGANKIMMADERSPHDHGTVTGLLKKRARRRNHAGGAAELDERVQTHIGNRLKDIYDAIVNEPVPEPLLDLLRQVDSISGGNRDSGEKP